MKGVSRSPQMFISLGEKFYIIFMTVSLKIETCTLTSTSSILLSRMDNKSKFSSKFRLIV